MCVALNMADRVYHLNQNTFALLGIEVVCKGIDVGVLCFMSLRLKIDDIVSTRSAFLTPKYFYF